ncbi:hypothetical protein N7501_012225 [Penicillium viridicatum]|nr:hypothetical protein N7501_012225 [Penicillium viridicatum]
MLLAYVASPRGGVPVHGRYPERASLERRQPSDSLAPRRKIFYYSQVDLMKSGAAKGVYAQCFWHDRRGTLGPLFLYFSLYRYFSMGPSLTFLGTKANFTYTYRRRIWFRSLRFTSPLGNPRKATRRH